MPCPAQVRGHRARGAAELQIPRGTEPLHGLWRCFSTGRRRAFRRGVRFGYLRPRVEKRKQERGYDQSYLLARETCRHWSVAPETLLQKTKDNVAQSSLSSREERQKNVVGAYTAVNEDKIKGQRILLIDDILTTSATLREAARVLREAGAERVICATLAAADED